MATPILPPAQGTISDYYESYRQHIMENDMFKGLVAEAEIPKRYKTIVRKLNEFINYLNDNHNFVLLPFGDGVGLVTK